MTDPSQPAGLVGQLLADKYQIIKRLGGGGMGEVFLAEHVHMKRRCAVKVLRAALATDSDSLQRFKREAQNASMISHPNVAQMYDFGEHGDLLYLVMEFIEGESMQQVLEKDGVMHPDMVADVIMQSASALDAAHARQVLHRDVKPDNIMLARNADNTYLVKLVDFGIARAMASTDKRVTQTGMVVGTPEFMSPEQIAGETLDARSDLYALALVAFMALTGEGAFPSNSSMENLILRLTSRPRTLLETRHKVSWPPSLQTVFDKALAPNRDERHQTVVEFASDLSSAVVQMSPSETSAFYRRALEMRAANPIALSATFTPPNASSSTGSIGSAPTQPMTTSGHRTIGPPPRSTQVAYAGPRVKKHTGWRIIGLGVVAAGIYIYVDPVRKAAAMKQAKVIAAPAIRLVEVFRRALASTDSAETAGAAAVAQPSETTAPKTPKKPATKSPDSLNVPARKPKTDSATGNSTPPTDTTRPPL